MEALATIALLQMTTAPRFANAREEDRYFQAHPHSHPRLFLVPFVSMAAVIGLFLLVVALAPLSFDPGSDGSGFAENSPR